MKVFLSEFRPDEDKEFSFSGEEGWVRDAVAALDEEARDKPRTKDDISVRFMLRRVDTVYMVDGTLKTALRLCCSRCGRGYNHSVTPKFSALFCKDPVMAGVAHLENDARGVAHVVGANRGVAKSERTQTDADEREIDITYITGETVALNEILTEQIQLQIPYQPLCKETCKGVCLSCGADQNEGRCACSRLQSLKKEHPFSALGELSVALKAKH